MALSPDSMAWNSAAEIRPTFRSMAAWAFDPRMSCRQSFQSKEIDSVKLATSAAGASEKRPLRDTGTLRFMWKRTLPKGRRVLQKETRPLVFPRHTTRNSLFTYSFNQSVVESPNER